MPSSRVLTGVLHNFLGTLTSRYTEFDGFWLFGFIVPSFPELDIDLLALPEVADLTPEGVFRSVACGRFAEQLGKAGLERARLEQAVLYWRRSDARPVPSVWGLREGYRVVFEVFTSVASGRKFRRATSRFILAHNPKLESRSGPPRPEIGNQ